MENIQSPKYLPSFQGKSSSIATAKADSIARNKTRLNSAAPINKICLSNIVELTEEYDVQGKTIRGEMKLQTSKNDGKQENESQNFISKFFSNMMRKSLNCLSFTYQKIHSHIASGDINIGESQISEMLTKLRKKKQKRICLLPDLSSQNSGKGTLVLDLDQTLVNIYYRKPATYDFQIEVETKGTKASLFVVRRFGLESFLFEMAQYYELVIFSSLQSQLVESILSVIDSKRHVSHFLSRQHCVVINKSYFIKPVRDLGRNPKKVIVVDSHPISASLNPENLYRIDKFKGSNKDRKLIKLGYFLKYLHETPQIKQLTPVEMHRKKFETKEIQICDSKENHYKTKQIGPHKKQSSQMELIAGKNQQNSVGPFARS